MEDNTKEVLKEEMDKYSRDNDVIALYSAYSRDELERNTLVIEAENRGIKQGIEQVAKNFISMGLPTEDIMKATGLTEEEVDKYSRDNDAIASYSAYSRDELERNTLVIEAKEEGAQTEKLRIAKNFLSMGLPVEDVMKATGLSEEQIGNLNGMH